MSRLSRSICVLSFYLVYTAATDCGFDENIDLSGFTITPSSSVETKNVVDRNLLTRIDVNNSGKKWIIVQLRNSSSEYRFVKSVTVVPARPGYDKKNIINCGTGDEKDTTICKFPFKHDNVTYHTCTLYEFKPTNCRQYRCSSGSRAFMVDEYSSCEGTQPNGSLSDNIQVMLSSKDSINPPDWNKFQSCGSTGTGLFNSDRTVSCESTLQNAKYVAFMKDSTEFQIAEINITLFKHDRELVNLRKENSTAEEILQISGCTPQFNIHKIFWFHLSLDKSETKKLGETNDTGVAFKIIDITRENSGYYYFEYKNNKNETFFKSNSIRKQVYFKSKFVNKMSDVIYVNENESINIICTVDSGYPFPEVSLNFENETEIQCTNIHKNDSYGGQSAECSTSIQVRSDNLTIICSSKQGNVTEYQQNSTIMVLILLRTSTTTTTTTTTTVTTTTTSTSTTPTTSKTTTTTAASATDESNETTTTKKTTAITTPATSTNAKTSAPSATNESKETTAITTPATSTNTKTSTASATDESKETTTTKITTATTSSFRKQSNNITVIALVTIPVVIIVAAASVLTTVFIMNRRFASQMKSRDKTCDIIYEPNENEDTVVEYEDNTNNGEIHLENVEQIQIPPGEEYESIDYAARMYDNSKSDMYYEKVL